MNNENNINGIPNINDVKIEETPEESFDSLYGNGAKQPTQPAQQPTQPAQQPMPNPQPVQSVQPQVAPAPQVVQPVQAQPVQPQPMPNPQVVQPVPPVQPQPMPNPQVVQPVPPVQPQPMPNPQVVQPTQQVVEPIQPVEIDSDRLQSIEEQLSKTSQYKPEDFQQEKIDIPTTNQYEKNKSGLTFVIVLFIILVLAIVAIPYITKFFS